MIFLIDGRRYFVDTIQQGLESAINNSDDDLVAMSDQGIGICCESVYLSIFDSHLIMFWIVLRWQKIKRITLQSNSAREYFEKYTNFQPLSRYSTLIAYVDTTILHHFYSRSSSAQDEHELKLIAEEELSPLDMMHALTHLANEHFRNAGGEQPSQRVLRAKMDEYEEKIKAIRYS